ncbi:MAG TPA: biotin transporter BioY [Methanocorpusculum sp.]|jgi:biotin transport system substrate-specific component|uniref:biotin transporter BioY n=1 Tax=Methanocorpusculum sp. GPch4 TaxID=2527877 RepID=UPI00143281BA|nr:biotin transporter BioY [Methanocorpusculum sp. GPch4]HJJ35399.1 biotin transporter BioY [Methanocorpusculum sp.]
MYGDEKRSALLMYSAVFTALITVGGWISVPFVVPFTLQTLFVLLAASVMKKYAVVPAALYVMFGTLGLPLFHNGTSGLGILLGPTGGFLIGFIPMAFIAGVFFSKKTLAADISGMVLGILVCYFCGTVWFMVSAGASLPAALITCVIPFIAGDAVKIAAAEMVTLRLRKGGRLLFD